MNNHYKQCPNGHYYPENLNSCPYCHSSEDKTASFPTETEIEEPWCYPSDYIVIDEHYYMLNSDKETASLLCWSKDAWDIYHEYLEFYDMYIESTLDEADYYKRKYEYYNQIRVKCIEEICKIPNRITYNKKNYPIVRIRSGAFAFCELNSLLMPDTITHIEKKAFFRCDGLKTLFIPSSVKNLAMGAISECKNLETITYDGTTYEDDIDELFIFPDQKNKYAIIDFQDLNNQTAIKCNNCGHFTPMRRRLCIYCGSNIHEPFVQSGKIAHPVHTPINNMHKFKQCPHGHYYRSDLEKCPYCADESDLRKGLSDISKDDSSPFRINNAMCYCQMPTDWDNPEEHLEHRRHVGWLINTKEEACVNYKLHEGRNIIGRDASCDISILDSNVSSKHAVVVFRNDKFSIMDNMSSWGTFVNGKDIETNRVYLYDGDIIKVGETILKFCSYVDDEHT